MRKANVCVVCSGKAQSKAHLDRGPGLGINARGCVYSVDSSLMLIQRSIHDTNRIIADIDTEIAFWRRSQLSFAYLEPLVWQNTSENTAVQRCSDELIISPVTHRPSLQRMGVPQNTWSTLGHSPTGKSFFSTPPQFRSLETEPMTPCQFCPSHTVLLDTGSTRPSYHFELVSLSLNVLRQTTRGIVPFGLKEVGEIGARA